MDRETTTEWTPPLWKDEEEDGWMMGDGEELAHNHPPYASDLSIPDLILHILAHANDDPDDREFPMLEPQYLRQAADLIRDLTAWNCGIRPEGEPQLAGVVKSIRNPEINFSLAVEAVKETRLRLNTNAFRRAALAHCDRTTLELWPGEFVVVAL